MKHLKIIFIVFVFIAISFFIWSQESNISFTEEKVRGASVKCSEPLISGDMNDKEFFDKPYASLNSSNSKKYEAKGAIVNHHLLAPSLIVDALEYVKDKEKIKVVYLISPNHFYEGNYPIEIFGGSFNTPYGKLCTHSKIVEDFLKLSYVGNETEVFEKEHGIYNIAPFIKRIFPNAVVVPIAVKENADPQILEDFSNKIRENFNDAIVVGSFDFSHTLSLTASNFHDKKSFDAINSFDKVRALDLDIDSSKGLYLLFSVLEKKAEKFVPLANSNSFSASGGVGFDDVTSYITGIFIKGEKNSAEITNLLFFGDMMLDRGVAMRIRDEGFNTMFKGVERLLMGNDAVVANLEGVLSSNESIAAKNSSILRFTFDPSLAPWLKKYHFTALSQANNHANDFGREAANESRKILSENQLGYFGDFFNEQDLVSYLPNGNRKVALLAFNEFSYINLNKFLELITSEKQKGNMVFVMPHWGIEYEKRNSANQAALAHAFIDSGADAIIGAHPHVVQNIEIYKGKAIFYSLGNFVFDQDFSLATMEGLGAGVTIENNNISYSLIPINIIKSKPTLKNANERSKFLSELASQSSEEIKEQIINGKIEIKNE